MNTITLNADDKAALLAKILEEDNRLLERLAD